MAWCWGTRPSVATVLTDDHTTMGFQQFMDQPFKSKGHLAHMTPLPNCWGHNHFLRPPWSLLSHPLANEICTFQTSNTFTNECWFKTRNCSNQSTRLQMFVKLQSHLTSATMTGCDLAFWPVQVKAIMNLRVNQSIWTDRQGIVQLLTVLLPSTALHNGAFCSCSQSYFPVQHSIMLTSYNHTNRSFSIQGSFWVWAQPMRLWENLTLYRNTFSHWLSPEWSQEH